MDKEKFLIKGTREDAAIIRSMIEHENNLINNRITWLITVQGLFFAALGFAWDNSDTKGFITVLSLLGVAVSLSAWTSFTISNGARRALVKTWDERTDRSEYSGPDVISKRSFEQDTPLRVIERALRPWRSLPFMFIISWMFVILFIWT